MKLSDARAESEPAVWPAIETEPVVASSKPDAIRIRVVLPEPL